MTDLELLPVPMYVGAGGDLYSGIARMAGRLWAGRRRATRPSTVALVFVHPTSNFLGHYLLEPLARRGVDAVGMNTRYLGNDNCLIMENCVLDIAATIAFLRNEGRYERVVLVGNSGGGGLAALYQSQAEHPDITSPPAGGPPDLTSCELPPVDGLIELMAHLGRATTLTDWLDPAIRDESDPFERDRDLDMFDPINGPPYAAEFVTRYRSAQLERNRRITSWVHAQLTRLEAQSAGRLDNLPFVVHGTCADLRFLDLSIDKSDRDTGTLWGAPYWANLAPSTLAHLTSLRSWLSQWSVDETNCDARRHLSRISVPALVVYGTADQTCTPEQSVSMYHAITHGRRRIVAIPGARHYFDGQPHLVEHAADEIVDWLRHEGLS